MRDVKTCVLGLGLLTLMAASLAPERRAQAAQLQDISHIIILYLENHSFDNLLGQYPSADGLAGARSTVQRDRDGAPYRVLPAPVGPFDVEGNPPAVRAIEIGELPNDHHL